MRLELATALAFPLVLLGCGSSPPRGQSAAGGANEPIVVERAEPGGSIVEGTDACATDADCVPADCCHAAACVARASAPSCAEVMCTADCRGGTVDCGGGCLCQNGRCAARLWRPEQPSVAPQ
ncbi:MAG: hypothetical protein ACK6CU_25005 [Deltaproteobacteria bacterium]|jgi:hypothetical protein